MKQFLLPVLVLALLPISAQALEFEYYGVEDTINEDFSVTTSLVLRFSEPADSLDYTLAFPIENLSSKPDFDSADCRATPQEGKTLISCSFTGMSLENNTLQLTFTTHQGVERVEDRYRFTANYGIPIPIKNTFVLIRLPPNGVLAEEPANRSYFPQTGLTLTDGKRIMVFWESQNVSSGDGLQFSVLYATPLVGKLSDTLIIGIAVAVIAVMVSASVYARRGRDKRRVEVVTSVLSADEKTIVDILNRHEKAALQKILVRESNFSKAKVSRLIKDMKARGMLEVEAVSGRENRIRLQLGEQKQKTEKKPETPKEEQKPVEKRPLTPGEPAEDEPETQN